MSSTRSASSSSCCDCSCGDCSSSGTSIDANISHDEYNQAERIGLQISNKTYNADQSWSLLIAHFLG